MYNEQRSDYYGYPYDNKIADLGVKIYDLKEAEKIMKDPSYLSSVGCNTYRDIEAYIDILYKTFDNEYLSSKSMSAYVSSIGMLPDVVWLLSV